MSIQNKPQLEFSHIEETANNKTIIWLKVSYLWSIRIR